MCDVGASMAARAEGDRYHGLFLGFTIAGALALTGGITWLVIDRAQMDRADLRRAGGLAVLKIAPEGDARGLVIPKSELFLRECADLQRNSLEPSKNTPPLASGFIRTGSSRRDSRKSNADFGISVSDA